MIYKSEYYNETTIESFIFSYGFKDERASEKEKFKLSNWNSRVTHEWMLFVFLNFRIFFIYNLLEFKVSAGFKILS